MRLAILPLREMSVRFQAPAVARRPGLGGKTVLRPDPVARAKGRADVQIFDCMTLADLSGGQPISLLHINIPGTRADVVTFSAQGIGTPVRRVLTGTPSRASKRRLFTHFETLGRRHEMERPALAPTADGRAEIRIDGVQM